jgi:hypothetical protein
MAEQLGPAVGGISNLDTYSDFFQGTKKKWSKAAVPCHI